MSQKLALVLFLFAVGACVAVGVVVYYVGLEEFTKSEQNHNALAAKNLQKQNAVKSSGEPEPEPELSSSALSKPKVTDVRLPSHLVPLNYKLDLVPFIIPDNFTIRGYAEVRPYKTISCNIMLLRLRWNVQSQLSMLLCMLLILQ